MFFVYAPAPSLGIGFSLYSLPHVAALTIIVLLCILCAIAYRRATHAVRQRVSRILGITILLMEILRTVVYHFMGGMSIYELPLHLCGMAVFLCAIHSLWKPDWLGQVLYALCLPGAWAALLFPDWTMYPFFSFVSLHSFTAHGLIVLYIALQTASGEIRPRLSAIWKPVLFLCVVVPPVLWFDHRFHANYMFLQLPSAGSPLVVLSNLAGGSLVGYLCLFAAAIFCVMVGMYLPFCRRGRRR